MVGSFCSNPIPFANCVKYHTSHFKSQSETYSLSTEDIVTIDCNFLFQDINPWFRNVVYPKWLLCVSLHITILTSTSPNNTFTKTLSLSCSEMFHVIPKSFVCMRYFMTHLVADISLAFGRLRCLESTLRTYETSNLTVTDAYPTLPINDLYIVIIFSGVSSTKSLSLISNPASSGVLHIYMYIPVPPSCWTRSPWGRWAPGTKVCQYLYGCTSNVYICVFVYMYIYVYIYVYVYMYTQIYIHIHICIYTHTHI